MYRGNMFDPDDRVRRSRPGANNLFVEPTTLMMYYTLDDGSKIVREPVSFETPAGITISSFAWDLNNHYFHILCKQLKDHHLIFVQYSL